MILFDLLGSAMSISPKTLDVIIIGAGISGLTAARHLHNHGLQVLVLDKSRGVGGRMATRKCGDVWFDHGAQFVTAHGGEFRKELQSWVDAEVMVSWFSSEENHVRFRGNPSMTAGPKHVAGSLDVRLRESVQKIWFEENHWHLESTELYRTRHLMMAFPVPQAMELLRKSDIGFEVTSERYLSSIHFHPCLTGLFTLENSSGMKPPGILKINDPEPIELITDNQIKGISKLPSVTVQAGPGFSKKYFDDRAKGLEIIAEEAGNILGITLSKGVVHGWRFSRRMGDSDHQFYRENEFKLWFCGDSFGPPRVEGAFLSGQAAAIDIIQSLESIGKP